MNEEKSFSNSHINWYPGHMAKTKRLIKEKLNLIDVVYELVDARIPYSSKIKDIDDLLKGKRRVLIMTKWDLCDKIETEKWVTYYEEKGYAVYPTDLKSDKDLNRLIDLTRELVFDEQQVRRDKGLLEKEIRVLVVGIPNVGKSTLINRLALRSAATTGNVPGVTKSLSFTKTSSNITLLDTPGILWPKLDDEEVALNLASMSAIKSEVLPIDDVAIHILKKLHIYYPNLLNKRYNIDELDDDFVEVYERIGRKIGALVSGGEVLYDRVSLAIINDIKNEHVKGITFDRR